MRFFRKSIILLLISCMGCSKRDIHTDTNNRCSQALPGRIIIDKDRFLHPESDMFFPDTAFIDGDILVCRLQYGGGCDYANLDILSNGVISMGIFPYVELKSRFIDKDICEALITEEFCFDLTSLDFLSSSGEIEFILTEWNTRLKWDR